MSTTPAVVLDGAPLRQRRDDAIPFHPLADIFPLLNGAEFEALTDDIHAHGLREAITLLDGQILDGRIRYRACLAAGVEPRFEHFAGNDPLAFVISVNLRRRHLNESQRAMIAARLANWKVGDNQFKGPSIEGASISQEQAAELLRVGVASVERAKAVLAADAPDLAEAVDAGQLKVSAAVNLLAKPEAFQRDVAAKIKAGEKPAEAIRQTRKEHLPANIAALPPGRFRVLYADPPWSYNDSRITADRYQSTSALNHYNVESLESLKSLDVKGISTDDSVLFCWATFPLLPDALSLVEAWGFKYKTAFVWDKKHGAFGHYHDADAELLLVATRGACTPEADRREKQIQHFARGEHSAKPDEWRALIDRLYPSGPRVELYARNTAPGWTCWGDEIAREAAE